RLCLAPLPLRYFRFASSAPLAPRRAPSLRSVAAPCGLTFSRVLPDSLSVAYFDSHRPGGSRHLCDRAVEVDGVEIAHLLFGDLADLVAAHRPDLLEPRVRRTLLDARGLTEKKRRRRRLGDEAERPVLEDRDLRRNDLAALVFGRGVVRLAEVHDVDPVRTERGPDRRRGRRLPRLDLDLHRRRDALLRHCLCSASARLCFALLRFRSATSASAPPFALLVRSLAPLAS